MALLDDDDGKKPRARSTDDGDKPSWRDLDRKRDRSAHSGPDDRDRAPVMGSKAAWQKQRESTQARSAAEALFKSPEKDKGVSAIIRAEGVPAITEALEVYRTRHGALPEDPEALIQALLIPDGALQLELLTALDAALAGVTGTRKDNLLAQLRIFRMSTRHMDARKASVQVLKRHGGLTS